MLSADKGSMSLKNHPKQARAQNQTGTVVRGACMLCIP